MASWPQVSGNSTKLTIALLCCVLAIPGVLWAGSLQPPGPPGPTMRTLDSLGFDCPNDPPGTTNLLFIPVQGASGSVTGLSIFNTGADPFGTVGQSGTCTINYYGTSAPSAVTTASMAPGESIDTVLNSADFKGYAIATCGFSYAHGTMTRVFSIDTSSLVLVLPATVICSDRGPTAMGQGR